MSEPTDTLPADVADAVAARDPARLEAAAVAHPALATNLRALAKQITPAPVPAPAPIANTPPRQGNTPVAQTNPEHSRVLDIHPVLLLPIGKNAAARDEAIKQIAAWTQRK